MGNIDVVIGVDADCVAGWFGSCGGADSPANLSRGLSTDNKGIPRMIQLFENEGIDTTQYILGHTIETSRDEVRAVAAGGHEIGVHGYSHENSADLSRGQEDAIIEKSIKLIEDVTDDPPVDHRASWWEFSKNTLELVRKHGLLYDSSLIERGFKPGYMRKGDSWAKIQHEQDAGTWMPPCEYGAETDMVEVPISWYHDDTSPTLFVKRLLYHLGYKDPSMTYGQYYKKQLEHLHNHRGAGAYTFTIHPDLHGLPHMIPFLEDFTQYVKSHENTEFRILEAVARRYKDDPSVCESESDYV